MKVFADKINVNEKVKFGLERVENIVGKGQNAGNQHFFPFPTMFSKGFLLKVVKVRIVWQRVKGLRSACTKQSPLFWGSFSYKRQM